MRAKFILFFLILFFSVNLFATKIITGKVTSADDGTALPGVSVLVKGTTIATVTDIDGEYELKNIPDDAKILVFSFIGMETQEVKIKSNVVNCVLKPSDVTVEDVVVTAAGISKDDKSKGYSSTTISFDDSRTSYSTPDYKKSKTRDAGVDYSSEVEADEISVSPSSTTGNSNIRSGMLTAGEVNDFGKWEMWTDIAQYDLKIYKDSWKIHPLERYCVLVTNSQNTGVIDAEVKLKSGDKIIWTAKTDNSGKAELWNNMFDSLDNRKLTISVDYQGKTKTVENPSTFHNGINVITVDSKCNIPNDLDIAFVVDATGSMSDEMQYLQAEILNVINRVDTSFKGLNIRLGSVFYRDNGDSYVTLEKDLTSDINSAVDFFKQQSAAGGGDFPEAVDSGLYKAIFNLNWSKDARARIVFLVLDAPPHQEPGVIDNLKNIIQVAASKGIRIIPVTCSGIDKSTEYLMRSMALATNGTYVFLTDDSGIGDTHIKPTTDEWKVEFLNDLLVRLITQYVFTPDCQNKLDITKTDIGNDTIVVNSHKVIVDSNTVQNDTLVQNNDTIKTNIDPNSIESLKIYPNPTTGPITIEVSGQINEFYICDFSGKILQRQVVKNENNIQLDISMYPPGFYFVRYYVGEAIKSGKIVLIY